MKRRRFTSLPRPGHTWGTAATLAATAVLAVACSSSTSGPQVASLGGQHGSGAAGQQLTTAQGDRDMVNFARCMRAHGVALGPGMRAANIACQHFIGPIIQAKQAGAAAAMSPARLAKLTDYARCMRAHDIPMLDPDRYGDLNLGRPPGVSSDFGRYSSQFRAADTACRHLLPAGVHDDGTGP